MIDGIRDLFQNGQPLVVNADDWRSIEPQLREAGISFWGWQHFQSDDGGDCIGVSVPADDYAAAQEIAGMTGGGDSIWGLLGKLLLVGVLLALVTMALIGGAA